ncbi:hypothetical protein WJX74_006310 [Apatococcus lobatus]|uniref:Uncharacterized protein n=2 Tax=Apatococcus TaxID=904362 RepID=A0AAW1SLL6_9CHLO
MHRPPHRLFHRQLYGPIQVAAWVACAPAKLDFRQPCRELFPTKTLPAWASQYQRVCRLPPLCKMSLSEAQTMYHHYDGPEDLVLLRRLPSSTSSRGVTPNHDTLYNLAFLDLSQGPQIITVPQFDTPRRYWIVPFADAYYNIYGAVGAHFNSSSGQYLVVGRSGSRTASYPGFTSDRIFFSPTDINWMIGRVLVLNDTDTPAAYAFSLQYRVSPYHPLLNATLNATSKTQIISRSVNGSGYGIYKNTVGFLDGFTQQPAQWFNASLQFYLTDPPVNGSSPDQVATLQNLIQNASDPSTNSAFQLGAQVAKKCILRTNVGFVASTGWTFHNASGVYDRASGTDYLDRAQDAQFIPTPLPPSEVIYFLLSTDSQNQTLDASKGENYTITFNLPVPASIFWSLTIYNSSNLLLFKNPIDRYNINDRSQRLVYTGTNNNTLQVFISASQPTVGTAQYSNWLPAPPDAGFQFILRTYGPPDYAIQGQYAPPAVVKVDSAASVTPLSVAGRKFV